jgi:hypothetical protein
MKLHACARGLLAGAISVMALLGGTGVAQADPDDIVPPPALPGIDQILIGTPGLSLDPRDRDGPQSRWGGTGMFCQNQWARCQ